MARQKRNPRGGYRAKGKGNKEATDKAPTASPEALPPTNSVPKIEADSSQPDGTKKPEPSGNTPVSEPAAKSRSHTTGNAESVPAPKTASPSTRSKKRKSSSPKAPPADEQDSGPARRVTRSASAEAKRKAEIEAKAPVADEQGSGTSRRGTRSASAEVRRKTATASPPVESKKRKSPSLEAAIAEEQDAGSPRKRTRSASAEASGKAENEAENPGLKTASPIAKSKKRKPPFPEASAIPEEDSGSPRKTTRSSEADSKDKTPAPAEPSTPKPANTTTEKKWYKKGSPWDPSVLLSSPRSKLVKADLYPLLSSEKAWTALTPTERTHLLNMLPTASTQNVASTQQQKAETLHRHPRFNDEMRDGASLFQEDLAAGRYASGWLARAARGMERRAEGEFDGWKEAEREEYWGQKGE
ncbi:MAG: hypothetical protein M1831_002007 [Alyxoria varia]|nr:MAG: hypothetical protein M1831_002007 [Alyxoria varia]